MEAMQTIELFSKNQYSGFFPCPRCGKMDMDENPTRNALSRRVYVYICDYCGLNEAVEDFTEEKTSLEDWAVVKFPEFFRAKSEN